MLILYWNRLGENFQMLVNYCFVCNRRPRGHSDGQCSVFGRRLTSLPIREHVGESDYYVVFVVVRRSKNVIQLYTAGASVVGTISIWFYLKKKESKKKKDGEIHINSCTYIAPIENHNSRHLIIYRTSGLLLTIRYNSLTCSKLRDVKNLCDLGLSERFGTYIQMYSGTFSLRLIEVCTYNCDWISFISILLACKYYIKL